MILPGFVGLIAALFIGCIFGVIAGLVPGLHTNTIAVIMLSLIGAGLFTGVPAINLAVFLIAVVITSSFVDYIPSIFLGAPEGDTALSVLPGHKLLLKGLGYKALKLTVIGGLGASLISILILPVFIFVVQEIVGYVRYFIGPLLLLFSAIFILTEKSWRNRVWGFVVFILSGVLGVVVLNGISVKEPLFPLLSGLFGIPVLLISLGSKTKIPPQRTKVKVNFFAKNNFFNYLKATFAGSIMSFMPAVGPAQAAMVAQGFSGFKKAEDFLVTLGGINTIDGSLTIATLYAIGKARSGAMVAIDQILTLQFSHLVILVAAGFAATGLAAALTLKIGLIFSKKLPEINYDKMSLFIVWFILSLAFVISGFIGLFIATISAAVGILAPKLGIKRIHSMGVLVLPVIFYYIL